MDLRPAARRTRATRRGRLPGSGSCAPLEGRPVDREHPLDHPFQRVLLENALPRRDGEEPALVGGGRAAAAWPRRGLGRRPEAPERRSPPAGRSPRGCRRSWMPRRASRWPSPPQARAARPRRAAWGTGRRPLPQARAPRRGRPGAEKADAVRDAELAGEALERPTLLPVAEDAEGGPREVCECPDGHVEALLSVKAPARDEHRIAGRTPLAGAEAPGVDAVRDDVPALGSHDVREARAGQLMA